MDNDELAYRCKGDSLQVVTARRDLSWAAIGVYAYIWERGTVTLGELRRCHADRGGWDNHPVWGYVSALWCAGLLVEVEA